MKRVGAHEMALREKGRRIVPLHNLQQRHRPRGPECLTDNWLIQLPELEPRVGRVLVFNLHDDDQALEGMSEQTISLAPPHGPAGAEAPPLRGKVGKRR